MSAALQSGVLSTPDIVQSFYDRIWNEGDLGCIPHLVAEDFRFRGSLGQQTRGQSAFADYVRSVRGALAEYRCEIISCVAEKDRAFAKVRFSGRHLGRFHGFEPTGKPIEWLGAALFHMDTRQIVELWVLGDVAGLDALLSRNESQ